eukprot:gene7403-7986_t
MLMMRLLLILSVFGVVISRLQQQKERLSQGTLSVKSLQHEHKRKVQRKQNQAKTEKVVQKLKELNSYAANQLQSSISAINQTFSFAEFSSVLPSTVSSAEMEGKKSCTFLGAHCPTEAIEHDLVRKYIKKEDIVLEFGGRFGTTSCEIARTQGNSGKLVSVEPDSSVWYLLAYNRQFHQCNFWIYRGVVSSRPSSQMKLQSASYDTRTIPAQISRNSNESSNLLPSVTIKQLEDKLKLRFNVLLIDCEGCINHLFNQPNTLPDKNATLFKEQVELLHNDLIYVKTIILEADMSHQSSTCVDYCVDYKRWLYYLRLVGFRVITNIQDPEFFDIIHYVLQRSSLSSS